MKKIPLMILLLTPLTAQAEIFTKGQICKAAIAVEMMRPAEGIVIVEEGTYPIVSYRRADDGKRFTYSCKISEQNNSVVWRGYLPDEKAWGRWRDGEYDSKI